MYEAYWELARRPFENVSDAELYYASEGHQGALLKLRYVIESGKAAGLLVGETGVGKTTVADILATQLPDSIGPVEHVVFPQMPPAELLAYLAERFSPEAAAAAGSSLHASVRVLETELARNTAEGRHAVLILDEAHLIDEPATWDALRLLTNFRSRGLPDLTIILVGQLPLLTIMNRMPSWEERLDVKCILRPLSLDATACYLQHRLAGCEGRNEIFAEEAVEAIHRLSGGLPRRINRLADLALVIGYAEEVPKITAQEIDAVCGELITVESER
jgi:general secretion pathway protein A